MTTSCRGFCVFGIILLLVGNTECQSGSGVFSGSGGSGIEGSGAQQLSDPICGSLVDLVFVVQGSGDIGLENYDYLREAVAQVISYFALERTDGFCVWVIVYGTESRLEIPQICERDSAIGQANFLSFPDDSGSVVGGAIELMRTQFTTSSRANSTAKLAVIISSTPPDDPNEFAEQIALARNEGVRVLAVAVGGQLSDVFPNVFVDRFLFVDSYSALKDNPFEVQNLACDLPDYCSTTTSLLIPNPRVCSSFLVCLRLGPPFQEYLLTPCPPGLFFNKRIGVCDFPWVSRCLVDPCFGNEFDEVPDIGGCSRFKTCRNGRTLDSGCCSPGERFVYGHGCIVDASCTTDCSAIRATIVQLSPEPGCDRSTVDNYPDWFLESGQLNTCDYNKVFQSALCECTSRPASK